MPRVDAIEKVTGKAKYTGDLSIPGMIHGKILRSPLPHARIKGIDIAEAESIPGVAAVLTAADLADANPYYSGRPVIAIDKVRYAGEPVAAVAAEDVQIAERAVALINVDYEELLAFVGLDDALRGDPPLIHANAVRNICGHERVEKGNVEQGFAEADHVFEDIFTFPMVYHYAMEPHAAVAEWNDEGIKVWSSAQHPFQVRGDLARIFRVPAARVQMIVSYLGGGFGSKSYTKFEPLVVALARKARRPVRIANSVAESMLTVRRHSARVRLKTGVKKDGTLLAREAEIYLDTGGYADNGPAVATRAATRVLGPYRLPHIRSDAYAVYTNCGSAGSFRAIGAPQTLFACESQMDMIASVLQLDPAEFRLKNLLNSGEQLQPRLRGIDANLATGLKKLLAASRWKQHRKRDAAMGLACAVTNAGANPISVAMVRLQSDGSVLVLAGSTEMGQGVRTVLSQIVAEELHLPIDSIRVIRADTAVTPYDNSTGSSRSTTLMGTAVQNAARDLRKQLSVVAAAAFKVKPRHIRLDDGTLICGEARMSFPEAIQKRFGSSAGELIGRGDVGPEITEGKLPVFWEVGMGGAELALDYETGELKIKRYVSLADVGKAIHPAQCIGQEEGAAMMGLGHTLFEEMVYHDGQLANSTLLGYRVPRFSDVPEQFHTILLENRDGPGPFGARGMGEGGLLAVAPSVTNALARGTGVRLKNLPLTPERVWRALKAQR